MLNNFTSNASEIKAENFLKKCNIIDSVEIVFKTVELLQQNRNTMEQKENEKLK